MEVKLVGFGGASCWVLVHVDPETRPTPRCDVLQLTFTASPSNSNLQLHFTLPFGHPHHHVVTCLTPVPKNMAHIHFFSLPRELRDIIYSYVLPEHIKLAEGWEGSLGLLLVSHRFRSETLDAFYTRLPQMTIVSPNTALTVLPGSPKYTLLWQKTEKLLVQRSMEKRNQPDFAFMPIASQHADWHPPQIFQCMPALREVTYEIAWDSRGSPSILLPSLKDRVLRELKETTLGQNSLIGWDVECRIVDSTRWRIEWSGVVALKRKGI
jgi:hypothetical protein